ncbi:flavin reductase family protein [Streptomyces sp. Je 1-369]|uniref:flavin reductase family protein n=1 Tax=Streptomyces sp. Je 1-369 TaxID=2966192 RepID=UPI002AA2A357|nr:flavin reductase family protein [Streptomyces sp. Je 1-369]
MGRDAENADATDGTAEADATHATDDVDDVDKGIVDVDKGIAAFTALADSSVYVVTAVSDGQRAGCLVGFASQCSLEPVRFAVWLSKANHTYRLALAATTLAVHQLPRDRHDLAERFGSLCSDRTDKFAGLSLEEGPEGAVVLSDSLTWFVGRIHDRCDGGDHVAFLLDPIAAHAPAPESPGAGSPLTLHDAGDITAGHPA